MKQIKVRRLSTISKQLQKSYLQRFWYFALRSSCRPRYYLYRIIIIIIAATATAVATTATVLGLAYPTPLSFKKLYSLRELRALYFWNYSSSSSNSS
ncbi:hypothetical protein C8J57DRAFT_1530128 [Mycena rebaudengoi]|nr:hypothetical protein C8J57DRAFT_1530128 [Mycena rebaudengoi]